MKTFSLEEFMKSELPFTRFWTNIHGKIDVSPSSLFEFLSSNGYYVYYHSKDKTIFPLPVRVENNIVSQIGIGSIIRFLEEFLISRNEREVFDFIMRSNILHKKESLFLLKVLSDNFLEDSKNSSYFFFMNCVLKIEANRHEIILYQDIEKLVWKSQIIDFDFELKTYEETIKNSVFFKFLTDTTAHERIDSKSRLDHLMTIIGYLLHNYKDKSYSRAVILMDENTSKEPNGGTGKSLLANAISQVRKITQEDGKNFSSSKSFAFQQVDPDTRILLLDDVGSNFDLEKIFPIITEGIQVEKKYKDRYTIPFSKSPKLLITTNYSILGSGISFKRRMLEFELSNYFDNKKTPQSKYGRLFFEDWNPTEWNYFYSLMIYCCQIYLHNGIIDSEPINIGIIKLRDSDYGYEFIEFCNDYLENGKEYDKNEFYHRVRAAMPQLSNRSQRFITEGLRQYCEGNRYSLEEGHSGSKSFFRIHKTK